MSHADRLLWPIKATASRVATLVDRATVPLHRAATSLAATEVSLISPAVVPVSKLTHIDVLLVQAQMPLLSRLSPAPEATAATLALPGTAAAVPATKRSQHRRSCVQPASPWSVKVQ